MSKHNMIDLTIQAAHTYLSSRKFVQSLRAKATIWNGTNSRDPFGANRPGTSVFGSVSGNRDITHDAASYHVEMDGTCLEDGYCDNSIV